VHNARPEGARGHDTLGGHRIQRLLDCGVLVGLGVLVTLVAVVSFRQPLVADDYGTLFIMREYPGIWSYLGYWYNNWSFTWPALLLQQVFVWSRPAYGLLNGAAFLALAVLSWTAAAGPRPRPRPTRFDLAAVAFTACTYWFGAPAVSETVSWSTGSAAYLWLALVMLGFAIPYVNWLSAPRTVPPDRSKPLLRVALMIVLGFTAGSTTLQPIAACGLILMVVTAQAIRQRRARSVPAQLWSGAVGFVLGALLTLTAPGQYARASVLAPEGPTFEPELIARYFRSLLSADIARLYPWLAALLAVALVLALLRQKQSNLERVSARRPRLIWLVCSLASTLPLVVLPQFSVPRTAFFPAVLLVVGTLSFLASKEPTADRLVPFSVAVLSTAIVALLLVTSASIYNAAQSARLIAAELESRSEQIIRERNAGETNPVVPPIGIVPAYGVLWWDLSEHPDDFKNQQVAAWFELESIRVSPQ